MAFQFWEVLVTWQGSQEGGWQAFLSNLDNPDLEDIRIILLTTLSLIHSKLYVLR
jgi:hypothetical protein